MIPLRLGGLTEDQQQRICNGVEFHRASSGCKDDSLLHFGDVGVLQQQIRPNPHWQDFTNLLKVLQLQSEVADEVIKRLVFAPSVCHCLVDPV